MAYTTLTEAQQEQWAIDGYLVLKNVLSKKEVQTLIREIDRLYRKHVTRNANPASGMDRRNLLPDSDVFIQLMDHPGLFDLILHLMGPYIQLSMAEAIVRVANSRMAGAIRLVSIERGHDPKNFAAMPFGGAGSLHSGVLIREVGLDSAIVPRFPGVTSAMGCVIADMRHDFVHTINRPLDGLDIAALDSEMTATAHKGLELLRQSGVNLERLNIEFELDMSYIGQTHTVAVALPVELVDGTTSITEDIIHRAFESSYRATYNRLLDNFAIRILSLRTAVIGRRPKFDLAALSPTGGSLAEASIGKREVWIDDGWRKTQIYDRLALPVGARISGPAILEQSDSTIFVDPGLSAEVDRFGNLVVKPHV